MDQRTMFPAGRALLKGRFIYLLVMILAMLVIAPLVEEFVHLRVFMDFFWSAIFIAAVYAVSQKKQDLIIGALLALPMLGFDLVFVYLAAHWSACAWQYLRGSVLWLLSLFNILVFIYNQERVSKDLIVGAALVYLLMALAWTFIFAIVETLHPGSYAIAESESSQTCKKSSLLQLCHHHHPGIR